MTDDSKRAEAAAAVIETRDIVRAIARHLGVPGFGAPAQAGLGAVDDGQAPPADDDDLDGQYGDQIVKFAPKKWKGAPEHGQPMSRCSPEFLDVVASAYEYKSRCKAKEGDQKGSDYAWKDARRARGWAKRLRAAPRPASDDMPDYPTSWDDGEGDGSAESFHSQFDT